MAFLRYRIFWVAVAIISFNLFFFIRDAVKAHHRMMFSNFYATHQMAFLPEWQPEPVHLDRIGHAIAVDKRLNILVCAYNDEPDKKHFYWGRRNREEAHLTVQYDRGPDPRYEQYHIDVIRRIENRIIVIDLRDMTRFEGELGEKEAERMYEAYRHWDSETEDLVHFMEPKLKIYGYPRNTKPLPAPIKLTEDGS